MAQNSSLPVHLSLSNSLLALTLDTQNLTLTVLDKRSNRLWRQQDVANELILTDACNKDQAIFMTLTSIATDLVLKANLKLAENSPEFTITIAGNGPQTQKIIFLQPFVTGPGTYLVVPMNEGISYPVEDQSIQPMHLAAY